MGTVKEALLALAERCEREQPSDELNWEIMEAVRPDHRQTQATPYGHSLDAAVTLVPEGWTPYLALRWQGDGEVHMREWSPPCRRIPERGIVRGKNYALALCAAALRARAASDAVDGLPTRTSR